MPLDSVRVLYREGFRQFYPPGWNTYCNAVERFATSADLSGLALARFRHFPPSPPTPSMLNPLGIVLCNQ